MKIIAMIPARYEASRFTGKLMKKLAGKPIIVQTYEASLKTRLFNEVYVVTDSDAIFNKIISIGGKAIMSTEAHNCGSDRIAEAVTPLDTDIVVNIQGDEPFVDTESLAKVLSIFSDDYQKKIDLVSIMTPMSQWKDIKNPNNVKVIVDHQNFAIYFSRLPIPYPHAKNTGIIYYKHKGIYAFRKQALLNFRKLPAMPIETTEKIEAIRYLEYGKKIKMVESHKESIGIDTPEDLEKASKLWKVIMR